MNVLKNKSSITNTQLAVSAKAENKRSLLELLQNDKAYAKELSSKYFIDYNDRQDYIQNCLLETITKIIHFNPSINAWENYRGKLYYHVMIDMKRNSVSHNSSLYSNYSTNYSQNNYLETFPCNFDIENNYDAKVYKSIVESALERLSEKNKLLLGMILKEKKYREIAKEIHVNVNSVGIQIQRLKKKLGKQLNQKKISANMLF